MLNLQEFDYISNTFVIEFLYLYDNSLYGSIPAGISRLSLRWIDIGENNFVGSLLEDFFLNDCLEEVCINFNKFTGTIPESRGDISKLSL